MRKSKINILGVSEVRWAEYENIRDKEAFIYFGSIRHENGVRIILDPKASRARHEYK